MTEIRNDDRWMMSQLIVAAEKFTFLDGKADIAETRALIAMVHAFSAGDPDMAAFEKLLVAIAEDGIVTPEESKSLSAAIAGD